MHLGWLALITAVSGSTPVLTSIGVPCIMAYIEVCVYCIVHDIDPGFTYEKTGGSTAIWTVIRPPCLHIIRVVRAWHVLASCIPQSLIA
jgi:hypothetical protein